MRNPVMRKSGPRIFHHVGEPTQPLALYHPCHVEGCEASAPFGYGVRLTRNQPGIWACHEHRQLAEAIAYPQEVREPLALPAPAAMQAPSPAAPEEPELFP